MQEIIKPGFKVDAETVARELQNFLRKNGNSSQGFKASLEEAGYDYGYFEKKFETKVLIKKYLDEKVFADASNESETKLCLPHGLITPKSWRRWSITTKILKACCKGKVRQVAVAQSNSSFHP